MSGLTLSLFGTFRAEIAGQPLAFRSNKVRALLLYLAIEPGPHWRDTLATLFWSEFPDYEARRNLSASLSRLRKSLAPLLVSEPDLLEVDQQSVHLRLSPLNHYVDVLRFESLLAQCQSHPHPTLLSCAACIQRLEEAVSWYGGTLLTGFTLPDSPAFTEWQLLRQERYLEQVLEALHTLTEHALLVGEMERAQALTQQQLALVPWREEAHRQLMRILVQRGQRTAALAQYERCHQTVLEHLGIAPEVETTALYQRIKRGTAPHNLPAPTTPLIGQEETLAQIISRLCDPACRLVTLVGLGGIGKSTLALAAAQRLVGHFRDGVYLVLLSGAEGAVGQTPDLLQKTTLSTLQAVGVLPQEIGASPEVALRAALRDKHLLLLLDNFETLLDEAPTLMAWLAQAPTLHLLVTSREPLNLRAETVIPIPPLRVPPHHEIRSEEDAYKLEPYSATQLFVRSTQRVQASFHLDASNAAAVSHICRLVGGMPLALEMAAAWSSLLSCQQIAERLATDLELLNTRRQDVPERQRSVRAVFEHSWHLLTGIEQQSLAALSIFAGSFSLEAAQAVLDNKEVAPSWPQVLVAPLDKTLIYRTPAERLELHPLVRQYAAEKLMQGGQQSAVRARHSTYYAALVEAHIPQGSHEREHVRVIEREIENVRAAWNWAVESRLVDLIQPFLAGLFYFYEHKGWHQEGEVVFGQALEHLFGESLPLESEREGEAQQLLLWLLIYRGQCSVREQPEFARQMLEQGLTLATRLENQAAMASALRSLGVLTARHSLSEAEVYFEQALTLYRALQDEAGIGSCFFYLGYHALGRGEYTLARQFHEQNLLSCRRTNHSSAIALELCNLAWIDAALGNYQASYHGYQEVLTLARTLDHSVVEGHALVHLIGVGGIAVGYERAQAYFEEALASPQYLIDTVMRGSTHLNLGEAALFHGLCPQAEEQLQQSLAFFRQANHIVGIATTLPSLGEATLRLGKREDAWAYYREAWRTARTTGTQPNLLRVLLGWAMLLAGQEMQLQAIELLALVLHHPATLYQDQENARQLLAEATSGMDPELVAAAQARGRRLELETVVEILPPRQPSG